MVMPHNGRFFTMFHFLGMLFNPSTNTEDADDLSEYPFSRGSTHITSANPYDAPDFDAGFMNDKR